MAEDGKKVAAVLGVGAGIAGIIYMATRAKAAPPEPPPGLANLYGKVTDAETGKAIPDVMVLLDSIETSTDGGGNYVFTNLEPGGYRLEFSKSGYQSAIY